jgi:transcriptional regulator with XRE-family HTH domain
MASSDVGGSASARRRPPAPPRILAPAPDGNTVCVYRHTIAYKERLVKLGEVLDLERERRGLGPGEVAAGLGIGMDEWEALAGGASEAERWGLLLAEIAIALGVPTARLVAGSGRAADARSGQVGALVRGHREQRRRSAGEMAAALGIPPADYEAVEAGATPLESWGPRLLAFAELVEEPVFDLLYPCGIALGALDADVLRRERLAGAAAAGAAEGGTWQSNP